MAAQSKCPMKPPKPLTYCPQCFFGRDTTKGCQHGAVTNGLSSYAQRIESRNQINSQDYLHG